MSIITPTNFNVQAQTHIDSRLIQADIAARNLIATPTRYWGMQVHVLDSDGSNNPDTYILQKGSTNTDISDDANWINLSSASVAGVDTQVIFNDGGSLGGDVSFYYDKIKSMLVGGTGGTGPDFTGAHAQAGSWSLVFGEDHSFNGSGRAVNSTFSGWHISVGAGTNDGASSAALGVDIELEDSYVYGLGFNLLLDAQSTVAIGGGHFGGGGLGDATRQLIAGGVGAINISHNTSGSTPGVGAFGTYSAILGGTGHNIPSDSGASVIIGGADLSIPATTTNMVLVPNLMINPTAGDYSTPANGQIWYNSSTNKFRARENGATVDLIGGGSSGWALTGTSTLTGNTVITNDTYTLQIGKAATQKCHFFINDAAGSMDLRYNTSSSFVTFSGFGYVNVNVDWSAASTSHNLGATAKRWGESWTNVSNSRQFTSDLLLNAAGADDWAVNLDVTLADTFDAGVQEFTLIKGDVDISLSGDTGDGAWDTVNLINLKYNTNDRFRVSREGGLSLSGNYNQEIHTTHVQLTTAQILALNTTPIDLAPAPGAGKYIQVLGASAKLTVVTTPFTSTTQSVVIKVGTLTQFSSNNQLIDTATTRIESFVDSSVGSEITENASLNVALAFAPTGGGSSIMDVYVQYVIIDTN